MASPFDKAYYDKLRGWRTQRTPDLGMTGIIQKIADSTRRQQRTGGFAWSALDTACPPELRRAITSAVVRRGVLTLSIPDAAARFQLDRWLRTGGKTAILTALRTASPSSHILNIRASG
jgi:hypothetical protein